MPGKIVNFCLVAVLSGTVFSVYGDTNIDPANAGKQYAWTENGGWLNLKGNGTSGVHVGANILQGFAWHENFGWVNFGSGLPLGAQYSNASAEDFGVNTDGEGNLSGYAWGENIGWINFGSPAPGGTRVSIDQNTGRFNGYAWAENAGWIAFETVAPEHVATTVHNSRAENWTLY